jgi:DNA-binding transcriptional LysR family regulator
MQPRRGQRQHLYAELDLNLLAALDALLAERSITNAARTLGLSPSAMSRTLTRLRAATGDPLLVRAGRDTVLTPHAEALRARTRGAVCEARALLSPARYAAFPHVMTPHAERVTTVIDAALGAQGLKRQVGAIVQGFPAALAVAMASDLVALLPASFMRALPGLHHGIGAAAGPHVFELPMPLDGFSIASCGIRAPKPIRRTAGYAS